MDEFIRHFEGSLDDVEPGSLTPETEFRSLPSWDSLAVLLITDMIDLEYGLILKKEEFAKARSLVDLHALIVAKLAK
jgi:acyl carrier protein